MISYLDADLIKEVKKMALDEERVVDEIVEDTTREWLAKRVKKSRSE